MNAKQSLAFWGVENGYRVEYYPPGLNECVLVHNVNSTRHFQWSTKPLVKIGKKKWTNIEMSDPEFMDKLKSLLDGG